MRERDRIVAWLRGPGPDRDNGGPCRHVEHAQGYCACSGLADAIEAGLHLKRPAPTIPFLQWRDVPSVGHGPVEKPGGG